MPPPASFPCSPSAKCSRRGYARAHPITGNPHHDSINILSRVIEEPMMLVYSALTALQVSSENPPSQGILFARSSGWCTQTGPFDVAGRLRRPSAGPHQRGPILPVQGGRPRVVWSNVRHWFSRSLHQGGHIRALDRERGVATRRLRWNF